MHTIRLFAITALNPVDRSDTIKPYFALSKHQFTLISFDGICWLSLFFIESAVLFYFRHSACEWLAQEKENTKIIFFIVTVLAPPVSSLFLKKEFRVAFFLPIVFFLCFYEYQLLLGSLQQNAQIITDIDNTKTEDNLNMMVSNIKDKQDFFNMLLFMTSLLSAIVNFNWICLSIFILFVFVIPQIFGNKYTADTHKCFQIFTLLIIDLIVFCDGVRRLVFYVFSNPIFSWALFIAFCVTICICLVIKHQFIQNEWTKAIKLSKNEENTIGQNNSSIDIINLNDISTHKLNIKDIINKKM